MEVGEFDEVGDCFGGDVVVFVVVRDGVAVLHD